MNRRALIAAVSTLAIGLPLVPDRGGRKFEHKAQISETHTVITIGSQSKPGTDTF